MMLTPETTWMLLASVQALHLLHHCLVKRKISLVEPLAAAALLVPLSALPAAALMSLHVSLAAIQTIGSLWIRKLSPE